MEKMKIMKTPDNLEALSKDLWINVQGSLQGIHQSLKNQKVYEMFPDIAEASGGEQKESIKILCSRFFTNLGKTGETDFSIAMASAQSGGKSTLVNVILEFPLLPAASNLTTACATEIHYGEQPSVQIRYYGDDKEKFINGPVFQGEHKMKDEIWRQLLEYACFCITQKVIFAETLQYYADKDLSDPLYQPVWTDLDMVSADPCQKVQMLLILFLTYVGQNDPNPSPNVVRLCAQREKLLKELGVDPQRDFSVLVKWNHPVLKQGLKIIDLPGFGANAGDKNMGNDIIKRSHTKISLGYLQEADAVFLCFDPSAAAGDVPLILKTILKCERMIYVVSKENRIIPIINKVDLPGAEQQIPFTTNQIQSILGKDLKIPVVYPISARSGEYRFVKKGLFPIQRTLKYWQDRHGFRKDFETFTGSLPTEQQVQSGILKRLKESYEHPYAFEDSDGKKCELNLEQWIQMMTTDYLSMMQTLASLELLHVGLQFSLEITNKLNGRIAVLEMLKKGGSTLTNKLVASLEDAIQKSLQEFNAGISQFNKDMKEKMNTLALEKGPEVRASYQKAFQLIEKELVGQIRSEADKMQSNLAGNYIIDPDECLMQSAKAKAEKNRKAYNNMLSKVQKFSVVSRLKDSEQKLSDMIAAVQKVYDEGLPKLAGLYQYLPQMVSEALDKEYANTIQEESGNQGQFNNVYGGLYQQLKESIVAQIAQFSQTAISALNEDTRIADRQKLSINEAAKLSVEHEANYQQASEVYVKSLQTGAFVADHAFNMKALDESLEKPFFSTQTQETWANDALDLFSMDYSRDIINLLQKLGESMNNLNVGGLKGSVSGMKAFITQKIAQGGINIDSEITNFNFYKESLIKQPVNNLMDGVKIQFAALCESDWANAEIKKIESIHGELISEKAKGTV